MATQKAHCGVSAYTSPNGVDIPRSVWERLIDEWIFSERNRAILKRRLLDGVTFERLADEFQMSERQIKTIVKRGLETLIKHI